MPNLRRTAQAKGTRVAEGRLRIAVGFSDADLLALKFQALGHNRSIAAEIRAIVRRHLGRPVDDYPRLTRKPVIRKRGRPRGITWGELQRAKLMRKQGKSWYAIAKALGRKSEMGIRARIDSTYRRKLLIARRTKA
jgi:hypothetical protein